MRLLLKFLVPTYTVHVVTYSLKWVQKSFKDGCTLANLKLILDHYRPKKVKRSSVMTKLAMAISLGKKRTINFLPNGYHGSGLLLS